MGGHNDQVCCVAYNHRNTLLATVESCEFPNINLWGRRNSLKQFIKDEKFIKYAEIPTNHSKGIKLIEFVARETLLATVGTRSDSAILIYDFVKLETTHQIIANQNITNLFNPLIFIERSEVSQSIFDTFFLISATHDAIIKISLTSGSQKRYGHG
jgi:WD40 repeat protein